MKYLKLLAKARNAVRMLENNECGLDKVQEEAAMRTLDYYMAGNSHFTELSAINTSCISESLSEKEKITALTKSMGFHPSVIGLELIESEAKSAEDLFTFVQNQRESGFVIVVDDFGSEHSNLERLMLIRPDIIKIDRNIIHNVDKDPYRQSVLKSIHSLEIGRAHV